MARDSGAGEVVSPSTDRLVPRPRTPVEDWRGGGVLDTKVSVPAPAMPVLPRPRLFDLLLAATEHRVTVVNASAGAGKTMLLASWLSWTTSRRAAWVSFDRNDNEPKIFWSYVVEAVRRATAGREGDVFGPLSANDVAHERFPERFLDVVAGLEEPVVLVIDQAHEITDPRLLAGLDVILRHTPATLRLVLSGRGLPAVGTARLRVSGDVADVGSAELACSPQEAQDLFRLYGLHIEAAEVADLLHRTEGWMAGLRLAALWWRTQPPGLADVSAFTGREPLVAEYLQDEVIAPLAARDRALLLRTCVAGRVSGALADALTGGDDGRQTLEALERENALVTVSGAGGAWYRYGPLLQEFLSHCLHEELPDEVPVLRRKAAQWYADEGIPVDAARNAVAARDWTLAAGLLVGEGARSFANGTGAELEALLAEVPAEEVGASPDLAEVGARARLAVGDPDGAEAHIRTVDADGAGPDGHLRLLTATELRLHQACLRGQVPDALVSLAYRLLDQIRESGTGTRGRHVAGSLAYWIGDRRTLARPRGGRPRRPRSCCAAARGRWVRCLGTPGPRLDGVAQRRGRPARRGRTGSRECRVAAPRRVGAGSGRIDVGTARSEPVAVVPRPRQRPQSARVASAEREQETTSTVADGAGPVVADLHPGADDVRLMYDLAQVQIDVERDRLDQAWSVLESVRTRMSGTTGTTGLAAGPPAEPPLAELVGLFRARVLIHRGDLAAAKAELSSAKDSASKLRPHVEHGAALLGVDIALHENGSAQSRDGAALIAVPGAGADPEAPTSNGAVAGNGSAAGNGSPALPGSAAGNGSAAAVDIDHAATTSGDEGSKIAADTVAEGRVHLAQGDPAAALDAVTPCLSGATVETRLLDTVGALLVAATAHRRLGTQAAAAGFLERALTLARDEGLIHVFLEAGRGVRALLTVMIPPQGPHAGFRSALLHRFDVQPAATLKSSDQLTRLTASERAVLRYLPSHLTNEEIAQDLCLSVNTVKSHLRTLYRKLGVTCRREAIARALQLELLR